MIRHSEASIRYARRNIRVVGIRLGPADTEIPKPSLSLLGAGVAAPAPLRRTGVPEEVAGMTVYLLSERAQMFATGSVFAISGGQMLGLFP